MHERIYIYKEKTKRANNNRLLNRRIIIIVFIIIIAFIFLIVRSCINRIDHAHEGTHTRTFFLFSSITKSRFAFFSWGKIKRQANEFTKRIKPNHYPHRAPYTMHRTPSSPCINITWWYHAPGVHAATSHSDEAWMPPHREFSQEFSCATQQVGPDCG